MALASAAARGGLEARRIASLPHFVQAAACKVSTGLHQQDSSQ
jgi:hypothetical protein